MRAVVHRVVRVDLRVPVGEAVVVLARRKHVLRAGILEERRPRIGIPLRRGVHRQKILVAELRRRAVVLGVPLHHARVAAVHVADIPLAAVRRHGVDAPVHHRCRTSHRETTRGRGSSRRSTPTWAGRAPQASAAGRPAPPPPSPAYRARSRDLPSLRLPGQLQGLHGRPPAPESQRDTNVSTATKPHPLPEEG